MHAKLRQNGHRLKRKVRTSGITYNSNYDVSLIAAKIAPGSRCTFECETSGGGLAIPCGVSHSRCIAAEEGVKRFHRGRKFQVPTACHEYIRTGRDQDGIKKSDGTLD